MPVPYDPGEQHLDPFHLGAGGRKREAKPLQGI
jgi:hypothetical protein